MNGYWISMVSSLVLIPVFAKSAWERRESKLSLALNIVGIIAASGLSIYSWRVTQKLEDESRRLSLVQSAPQVLYEWNSNFASLRFSPGRNPGIAASELFGQFGIRNQHAQPLNSVTLTGVFGFDHKILTQPYSANVIGKRIFWRHQDVVPVGEIFSVDVVDALRKHQFDLRLLFIENETLWKEAAEWAAKSKSQLDNRSAINLNQDSDNPLFFTLPTFEFLSMPTDAARVLYGRITAQY